MYKKNAAPGDAEPGVTTYWLDGNPSTFRRWYDREFQEPNEEVRCVRYTERGFMDRACNYSFYFTCKMNNGKLQKAQLEHKLLSYHRCAILLSSVDPLQFFGGGVRTRVPKKINAVILKLRDLTPSEFDCIVLSSVLSRCQTRMKRQLGP